MQMRYKPVSPVVRATIQSRLPEDMGMDHRSYFAAIAMQGLLARDRLHIGEAAPLAVAALKFADALIAELEK